MQLPAPPLLLRGTAPPDCSQPQQMARKDLLTSSLVEAENAASTLQFTNTAVVDDG